ncbi:MAG TPA: hypothetical protein VKE50_06035 [Thermoanaerobaculia bacterium]|nr:hypothetical protein [Thermoanaerobaculia bacterium]
MSRLIKCLLPIVIALLLLPSTSRADDLSNQDLILCTAASVMLCQDDGDCVADLPWNLNIPQFIQVNVKDKTLSTTKASGENRSTPIRNFLREDGQIFLQGVEAGRAFSFVINEQTGLMVVAVARAGKVVSVFGACTPLAQAR